jgi:phosphoribosylglycinamide formyltransferase-1
MKILLLASGAGSLARAICEARISNVDIVGLIADKRCPALDLAEEFKFPFQIIPMNTDRSQWDSAMLQAARSSAPDLVVSVGFMRILAKEFINEFPTVNTHPALLPLFPGAHAVRDALWPMPVLLEQLFIGSMRA